MGPSPNEPASALTIRPLADAAEAEACARLMADMDPWRTLGRDHAACLRLLRDPHAEVYVAEDDAGLAGGLVLSLVGALSGYVRTILVAPGRQGRGYGTRLMEFAERRIFRVSPNAFLCVSSFNPDARRLYERLGYEYVGELRDYLVRGHAELLYRKSLGPWNEFVPPAGD